MIYAATLLAIVCFMAALKALAVLPAATKALETTGVAVKWMSDPALSELEKERRIKEASRTLMRSFFSIVARSAAAIGAAVAPLLLFDVTGLVRLNAVTDLLASWRGIALTSVVMIAAYFIRLKN